MISLDVWQAIDAMAADNHMTCSGMAIRGGLCSTAFNRSKRETAEGKARWPSLYSVVKVLNSMEQPMRYFADYVDSVAHARQFGNR